MKKLMKSSGTTGRLLIAAVIVLSMLSSGCVTTVGAYGSYGHPRVLYTYYYYPALHMYFDISSGYYWYRDHHHHHWRRDKHAPPHLAPHDHHRVILRLDTDRPYKYYEQHRDRYRKEPSMPGHWRESGHSTGRYQAATPSGAPKRDEPRRGDGYRDGGYKQSRPTRISDENAAPVHVPVDAEPQRQDSHGRRPNDERNLGRPGRAALDKARNNPMSTRGPNTGAHFPQRPDKHRAQGEKIPAPRGQGITTDSRRNKSAAKQKGGVAVHATNRSDADSPTQAGQVNRSSVKANGPHGRKDQVGVGRAARDETQH